MITTTTEARELLLRVLGELHHDRGATRFPATQIKSLMQRQEAEFDEKSLGFFTFSAFLSNFGDLLIIEETRSGHQINLTAPESLPRPEHPVAAVEYSPPATPAQQAMPQSPQTPAATQRDAQPSSSPSLYAMVSQASNLAAIAPSVVPQTPCCYLLVDGENIDVTLGQDILGHQRPLPEQRPRWELVKTYCDTLWKRPTKALFFINVKASKDAPFAFVQALRSLGFIPILLTGPLDAKVVDIAVLKMLNAIAIRDTLKNPVVLASHDGADFAAGLEPLLDQQRPVAIIGFRELVSDKLRRLMTKGLSIIDLEDDVKAFKVPLPRLRVIPIDQFDPLRYL